MDENSLDELLRLGQMGLDLGYHAEAEAYFDRALALAPDHFGALIGKARACQDAPLALSVVRQALAVAPEDPAALALEQELTARLPSPLPQAEQAAPKEDRPYILPAPAAADERPPQEGDAVRAEGAVQRFLSRPLRPRTVIIALGTAFAALLVVLGMAVYQIIRPEPMQGVPTESPPTAAPTLGTAVPAGGRGNLLLDAQAACVFLVVPNASSPEARRGSGSVIASNGLVLTNYHVLTDDNLVLVNSGGMAFVGFTEDVRNPPSRWYIAVLINGDIVRDLAVLRIVAEADGTLMREPVFPTMPLGDSAGLQLGQPLMGLGYPALGGKTLTLTRGVMGGFDVDGQVRLGKTDSELLPGSSGGAVLDEQGRLVGIIREMHADYRTQGRLSYFVLFSEAQTLIRNAQYAGYPRIDISWMVNLAPQLVR